MKKLLLIISILIIPTSLICKEITIKNKSTLTNGWNVKIDKVKMQERQLDKKGMSTTLSNVPEYAKTIITAKDSGLTLINENKTVKNLIIFIKECAAADPTCRRIQREKSSREGVTGDDGMYYYLEIE